MDVKDPVCGMDIEKDEAAGQSDFQGKTFTSVAQCKEKFEEPADVWNRAGMPPAR